MAQLPKNSVRDSAMPLDVDGTATYKLEKMILFHLKWVLVQSSEEAAEASWTSFLMMAVRMKL